MLFNNLHLQNPNKSNLNEGNFISKDITGIFDSDASGKLSSLTIDKLFEGLDIEKSEKMHDFISTNAPSIKNAMDYDNSDDTFAIEVIKQQMNYIANKIAEIEKEFDKYYNFIINAYKTTPEDQIEQTIAGFTSPEGFSSIIPVIEDLVREKKESGLDLDDPSKLEAFSALHRIKMSNLIDEISKTLEQSAHSFGIINLYKKIDAMPLEEIKSDYAVSSPDIYIAQAIDFEGMYKSDDPVARMSAFFEDALDFYPFIKQLKRNFNDNYTVITDGDLVGASIKQFVPKMDYYTFRPISELLNKVCGILVNRVYVNSPEEDNKNIFVPALQAIYVGLLAIVSTKLINFNIKVQTTITQKEKEKQESIAKSAEERVKRLHEVYKLLIEDGFFMPGSEIYGEGEFNMESEIIKNINQFLHYLNLLPETKVDSDSYDSSTTEAVRKFQEINKAEKIDGKIGPETKAIMEKTANFLADKYNIS